MFGPQNLGDAVFLTKQEENKITKSNLSNSTKSIHPKPFIATSMDAKLTSPTKAYSTGDNKKTRSTLSSKELLERRARGYCFHCDDLHHPGKDCKTKLYMMWGEIEEEDPRENHEVFRVLIEMEELLMEECIPGEISLNALAGNHSLSTIRMQGDIKNKSVRILIDSEAVGTYCRVHSSSFSYCCGWKY